MQNKSGQNNILAYYLNIVQMYVTVH